MAAGTSTDAAWPRCEATTGRGRSNGNANSSGAPANADVKALDDLDAREFFMLLLLVLAVLAMGLYPKTFTDVMHVSVQELLRHVAVSKLP